MAATKSRSVSRVVIGVDPHKRIDAVVVLDERRQPGRLAARTLPVRPLDGHDGDLLGVGQLEQPIGIPLSLRRQVTRLFLGHPQDLLRPTAQVVEVGMGPILGSGEVVSELTVLVDQPLHLTLEVAQPGLDGADEAVHGIAVVAATIDREVAGGEG